MPTIRPTQKPVRLTIARWRSRLLRPAVVAGGGISSTASDTASASDIATQSVVLARTTADTAVSSETLTRQASLFRKVGLPGP